MTGWTNKGRETTESFEDRQGTEIMLDETYRSWSLVVTQISGAGATLGIWGVDASGRDAIIYNGGCTEGQKIPVDMQYRSLCIAVNFVPDDPPLAQRWQVLEKWYRQSLRPARVELEIWVHQ